MAIRRSLAHISCCLILALCCLAAGPVAGEPDLVAASAVSPADDPWLSDDSPPVLSPVEPANEVVIASWKAAPVAAHARASALRRVRLELGLGDMPAPAAVVASAATEENPEIFSEMAQRLAPNVPAFQVDHALALWKSGDIGGGVLGLLKTGWVTANQLPSQLWMLENFSVLLMLTVVFASLAFIFGASLQVFPHAAHDFGDLLDSNMPNFARYAALAALVIAPLAFGEGLAGLVLVLFTVAFAYGASGNRSALVLAAVILLIGIIPLARVASVMTTLVDQDKISKSTLAVLDGTETLADVELLEASSQEELVAAHALAYRARRYGQVEDSGRRFDELISRYPGDVVALSNRGNIENRKGQTESAISFYESAAAQTASPILLFNLSQAYANAFRMEEYEATLVRAQMLGDEAVAELSSLGDAKLVADLGYPISLVRERLIGRFIDGASKPAPVLAFFAPGYLGKGWPFLAGGFAMSILVSTLLAGRWDHASLCTRCGHRICTRCEDTVWSDELCEDCHHLFQYPEATDPALRMARLQALSERETKIDRIFTTLSLMIPGVAGFAARRHDLALFSLLLFGWLATWIAWPTGFFADPLLMGNAAVILFSVLGVLAVLAYSSVILLSLIVRKNR